jgi:endonuclease-3
MKIGAYAIYMRQTTMKKQKSKDKKVAARSAKGSKSSSPARRAKTSPKGGANLKAAGTKPQRVSAILQKLDEAYPNVTCALEHHTPFQLLISTILSAQCTDERVNQVTKTLFVKYRTPKDFAYANPAELEQDIRPTGFFRNKTKSIIGAGKKIVEEFAGEVPRTMDELLTLPGVARKTANVVLGTAFGIAVGVVVDTHVIRLSNRLDLSRNTDPKKIEQDLMQVIPPEKWVLFSHQLIWHGRKVCQARKPRCAECNLERLCYAKDKTV